MALFRRDEVMRPLTLAVLVVIAVFVVVLRVRNGDAIQQVQTLNTQTFGALVNSIYPSTDELKNLRNISLTTRERKSESIHMLTRDGRAVQGYISKPAGSGPFPFILIVPDPFMAETNAQTMSQTLGELYATSLKAAVLVIETRSTHRGVDDVIDVVAPIEWQDDVAEIHDQPQFVVGIGYGAWLVAQASKTVVPQHVAYLSPIFDLNSTAARNSFRPLFIAQSDCETIAAQEACVEHLSEVLLPAVPTYVQFSSSEAEDRSTDSALITESKLSDLTTDVLVSELSVSESLVQKEFGVLAESLPLFSDWFEQQSVATNDTETTP